MRPGPAVLSWRPRTLTHVDLRHAAQAADAGQHQAGLRADKLSDCGDQLRKCFAVSLQAPGEARVRARGAGAEACALPKHPRAMRCAHSPLVVVGNRDKKLAALDIVNVSIKIYFKLNTLRLW